MNILIKLHFLRKKFSMGSHGTTTSKTTKNPSSKYSTKKKTKNPYADIGRDKFSALLAQVEERKQEIFSQISPAEASLVRFVYSSDNKLKPVVVGAKGKTQGKIKIDENKLAAAEADKEVKQKTAAVDDAAEVQREAKQIKTAEAEEEGEESGRIEIMGGLTKLELGKLEPSNCGYLIAILILILLFTILYERYSSTLYLLEVQSRLCQRMG
ncbi:hypothetical protein Ancab_028828 [Ancistrocladus abbreviatus]